MISDLKPYPDYRESELPWLSEYPSTWKMLRGKSVFGRVDVRSKTGMEELLTVSANHGVIPRRQTSVTMFMAKSYIGHKLCWPGDLVVNSLWAWMQGLGVARNHGLISSAYSVYRPRAEYSEYGNFFHHLFRSDAYKWELLTRSKGVWISRLQLSDLAFMDMPVLLPPPDEQAAIVRFLNHTNQRTERTIRAKRKVIALLNEQKQVIIHRAVTRGLNPNVRLKPSGIPWLGEIPEHWETPLNQRIFKENIRNHNGLETQLSLSQRDGLIPTSGMQERSLQTSTFDNWKVTLPGDLVLNRFKAHLGVFFAATLRGIVSFHYGVFAPRVDLDSKYFELLFHTNPYKAIYAGCSNGMTVGLQNLSNQNFYNVRAIVPPIAEQKAIVAFSENETVALNTVITRTEHEIELLREYRTCLIADVVTGKLDVREVASQLPDEIEELESLDEIDDSAEIEDLDAVAGGEA